MANPVQRGAERAGGRSPALVDDERTCFVGGELLAPANAAPVAQPGTDARRNEAGSVALTPRQDVSSHLCYTL